MNIKELRAKAGITQVELADKTGIPRDRITKWEQGKGKPKTVDYNTLEKYFSSLGFNSHFGDDDKNYEGATRKALQYRISLKEKRNPIPVMNVKAAAGTIAVVQDEPELIVEYLDVPFVGMVDGAIEIVGESMLPTLSPGARAAVRRLEDKKLLIWGEVYYVVDSNYEGYVKRLYPGTDDTHITLKSDNDELYPPVTRRWENIVAIFKVKANITKH